jgi:hypothetical protein
LGWHLQNKGVTDGINRSRGTFFQYKFTSSQIAKEFKNSLPFFSITQNLPSIYEDKNIQNFQSGDAECSDKN